MPGTGAGQGAPPAAAAPPGDPPPAAPGAGGEATAGGDATVGERGQALWVAMVRPLVRLQVGRLEGLAGVAAGATCTRQEREARHSPKTSTV